MTVFGTRARFSSLLLDCVETNGFKRLIFPLHVHENHWIMCEVQLEMRKLQVYDSGNRFRGVGYPQFDKVVDFMYATFKLDWVIEYVLNLPQQTNGNDCGVFTMRYLQLRSKDEPGDKMRPRDVALCRQTFAKELLEYKDECEEDSAGDVYD